MPELTAPPLPLLHPTPPSPDTHNRQKKYNSAAGAEKR